MNDKCEHEKVYAPYQLMCCPPIAPWICKICGEEGFDQQNYNYSLYMQLKAEKNRRLNDKFNPIQPADVPRVEHGYQQRGE